MLYVNLLTPLPPFYYEFHHKTGNSPNRRVLLLVNPIGGKGNARTLVKNEALPVLYAAGCRVEVVETTHNRHAEEFVRDLGESELEEYE